jgi:hypothetical protein
MLNIIFFTSTPSLKSKCRGYRFGLAKTIADIQSYKIDRDTSQVFNWRNCDFFNNLKAGEKSVTFIQNDRDNLSAIAFSLN